MKYLKISVMVVFLLPMLFSCASAKFDQIGFDKAYRDGNYELCMKMLKGRNYGKNNAALKNIDIGVLAHYAKKYEASATYFNEGDRLLDAGKLDGVAQFESFYLNILNALNYYHQNKIEDAVVELKKADDIKIRAGRENTSSLWHIVDESGNIEMIRGFDEDEEPDGKLQEAYNTFGVKPAEVNEGMPRKPTVEDLYHGSVTAYYLGALLRNASGDTEGARLDRDYVTVLNPTSSLRQMLSNALTAKENNAYLNIMSFSGSIAAKEEVSFYFPKEENGEAVFLSGILIPIGGTLFSIPPIRFKFAYPVVGENITKIDRIETVVTNAATGTSDTYPLMQLEDFGEEVKKNNALKARKEYQRNAAKSILGKLMAAVSSGTAIFAARKAVEQAGNPIAQAVAQIALDIAEAALPLALEESDASIRADIRQAKFLPAKASVTTIALPPATYNVTVRYFHDSLVLFEETFDNVQIKDKELKLLESICLK